MVWTFFIFIIEYCKTSQNLSKLHTNIDIALIFRYNQKKDFRQEVLFLINKISRAILTFVYNHSELPPDMMDIYQYGIEITLSSILNILFVLICSLILGNFISGIIYLFVFIFLRSFTGGFHASSYFKCNLTIIVTYVITFVLYELIITLNHPIYLCTVLSLINIIPIACFSPVPNKHKPLTQIQKKQAYKRSLIIASALTITGLMLIIFNAFIGAMIITSVTMVTVLIVTETFMQRRGYHES